MRGAAVAALGEIGGDRATTLARDVFAKDSSYETRAAALGTLVRLDSAHARDLIQTGLTTPSYQEAIQNAAFGAIARTNDTTFIGTVEGMLGVQRFPAHILAILGARGNARALDLLVKHLNDDRAAVRRWAIEAFQFTLGRNNPAVALERLKGALPGITHPETKRAATDLIAEWEKPPAAN